MTPSRESNSRAAVVADALMRMGWTCDMHEPDEDCEECRGLYDATASEILRALDALDEAAK